MNIAPLLALFAKPAGQDTFRISDSNKDIAFSFLLRNILIKSRVLNSPIKQEIWVTATLFKEIQKLGKKMYEWN